MANDATPAAKLPSLWVSLVPVAILVALLMINVRVFESADNQIALILATTVAAGIAVFGLRQKWHDIEQGILKAIGMAMQAMLILMVVGTLISAWIKAGVVPLLVFYGLEIISPEYFLVTACLVCCVVSTATGSSWTTAGTVGVALMGVGATLGLNPGLVAGAVVSGAYFGDKMSPLSDTTNLAPAMAGATLIEHVRHMIWTVTPSILIALAFYWFLGGKHESTPETLARVDAVMETLKANFRLSPWLLVPPVLVLALIMRRTPAIPALIVGTFSAVLLGLLLQPRTGGLTAQMKDYFLILYGGYAIDLDGAVTADAGAAMKEAATTVDNLLDGKGGMKGMMGTIALIFCALSFGGVMERSGMLGAIAQSILKLVRGTGSLVAATITTCFGVNVLASDQYMAIVVPGRMFRTAFLDRGLHPKNLSRCLEDSGTVTSALIPWNTCGAQMTQVLGVATAVYWKFAFLNWLCPIISIILGLTGISMAKITEKERDAFKSAA